MAGITIKLNAGLAAPDQTKMKKKRRTLKNRGYAETTRRKKEDEIKKLEAELKDLEVCRFSI